MIRGLLGHKFGREYIAEASDDTVNRKWQVNENLKRCGALRGGGFVAGSSETPQRGEERVHDTKVQFAVLKLAQMSACLPAWQMLSEIAQEEGVE